MYVTIRDQYHDPICPPIPAEPFDLAGHVLAVHRHPFGNQKGWTVTEPVTGQRLAGGPTRKAAIAEATTAVEGARSRIKTKAGQRNPIGWCIAGIIGGSVAVALRSCKPNPSGLWWDEPEGCATPRGWLRNGTADGAVASYLDYGPLEPERSEPVHVSVHTGNLRASLFVATIADAKAWVASFEEVRS